MGGFINEAVRAVPRVTISGRGELMVENSCGICEFCAQSITLRTNLGVLIISGENLQIISAEADGVAVSGRISSVSFM